jgi:DNA polymerase-3 subunit gamma/tau
VPATIVSRCQTFRFRPLTLEEITTHLLELAETENIDLSPVAAKVIAKNAGGAMRDALTLLDRAIAFAGSTITEAQVGEMLGLTPQELLSKAIGALIGKDNTALHETFQILKEEGFDANAFLKDIKNTLGDLFYFSLGQGSEPFAGAKQLLAGASATFLAQLSRKVNKLIEEVKFSDNTLISAELGLFTIMDSVLDVAGFVRRLEALERGETLPPPQEPPQGSRPPQPAVAVQVPPKAEKIETRKVEVAPVKTEEEPLPEMDQTISNRQIWDKMLAHFFKKSPFIYDMMINCSVEYGETEWTLCFANGKDFYRKPAQNKLADLSESASQISGRPIRVVLEEKLTEKQPVAAPAKKGAAANKLAKEVISAEEPFARAEELATEKAGKAPEEVQKILDVFSGEGELLA